MSSTDRLAKYAAAYRFDQLPVEAVEAAKVVVLDTLGALLLGSLPKYSASRLTGDLAKMLGGMPECTVIGRGFKTNVAQAALANGVMGYAADVEGGGVWRQHAAAVLVPTALTVGERAHADGRTLIAALALGYDVAARIDRAADPGTPYPHSFHPSGVYGHFGAAAAAGHILKLDQGQFVSALGLAGINAGGLMAWVNDPTEDSRPYVVGMAAHCGVIAALLAKMDMGGPPGIADDGKYTIYDAFSGAMHLEEVTRDLGEVFWITRHGGFKQYPCCGDIHSGLDALLKIVVENDLQPVDILELVHRVHPSRAKVIDNNPLKSHCAQYIMAVAAIRREINSDTVTTDLRLTDPLIRDLSRRVCLIGDPANEAFGVGSAAVEVLTRDGRLFREVVKHWRGHRENPLSQAELEGKFMRLATTRIPPKRAERLLLLVNDLERLDDTARLMELLSMPEATM
ncbi:MAG: MmgE/PrpD family protein [Chloroflexia bacterium]|nr:MmgE/PrpD family protein [Chloroflexia bacterium]MDQ3328427.1 MmgE/PrpD family protein [Chloroflexota bacterium]